MNSKPDIPRPYQAIVEFDEPRLLVLVVTVLAAITAGVVAASGNFTLIAVLFGLIMASVFLPSRRALLLLCISGGLVIAGSAQLYIPGTRLVRYIIPLVTVVLFAYAIMDSLQSQPSKKAHNAPISLVAVLFMMHALTATALNWESLPVAFDNLKAYFQMWLLLFCFSMIAWEARFIDALPKLLFAIALLQLPLVLHQYLVLVPMRQWLGDGVVAVDILVGSFGGEKLGGGANSVLALYLLGVCICLLAAWRRGAIKANTAIMMSLLFMLPNFFNQAKVVAIYIPIALFILFISDIRARPGRFLLLSIGSALLVSLLFVAMISAEDDRKVRNFDEYIDTLISRQTASISERNGPYAALSRVTALTFWAEQHVDSNITYTIFGHGPGASRVQSSGVNLTQSLAERRYGGIEIGVTAAAALLWDTGIIGLALILYLHYSVFRSARRSANSYAKQGDSLKAGILEGISVTVVLIALSLFHKDYFVFNLPYQTLLMTIFGYVVYQEKQLLRAHSENAS